jgi:hypothetical protein
MTDFSELDDATAQRILSIVARGGEGSAREILAHRGELRASLAEHFGVAPTVAPVPPGDLARQALTVLASHPQTGRAIEAVIDEPAPPALTYMDPFGITLLVAAIVALQTEVEIRRDGDGRWTFAVKKKGDDTGVKSLIQKLLSYLS